MLYKEKRKIVTLTQTILMLVQTVHLGEKMDLTAQKGKRKGQEDIL
jgi:uncharacterized protein Veg